MTGIVFYVFFLNRSPYKGHRTIFVMRPSEHIYDVCIIHIHILLCLFIVLLYSSIPPFSKAVASVDILSPPVEDIEGKLNDPQPFKGKDVIDTINLGC